jgi:hypothetical protein
MFHVSAVTSWAVNINYVLLVSHCSKRQHFLSLILSTHCSLFTECALLAGSATSQDEIAKKSVNFEMKEPTEESGSEDDGSEDGSESSEEDEERAVVRIVKSRPGLRPRKLRAETPSDEEDEKGQRRSVAVVPCLLLAVAHGLHTSLSNLMLLWRFRFLDLLPRAGYTVV